MNHGLLGFPPGATRLERVAVTAAATRYTLAPSTTLYKPLCGEDGASPLGVTLVLPARRLVLCRIAGHFVNGGSDEARLVVYDNGARFLPTESANGGTIESQGWGSWNTTESNQHQVCVEASGVLGPGAHRLEVWVGGTGSATSQTWQERSLVVEVYA